MRKRYDGPINELSDSPMNKYSKHHPNTKSFRTIVILILVIGSIGTLAFLILGSDMSHTVEESCATYFSKLNGTGSAHNDAVQRADSMALCLQYGPGPHIVEIHVKEHGTLKLRMFSEDMPHSTLLFLSQVKNGLWDGCSFIRNAGHVLQANPQTGDKKSMHAKFKDANLASLTFQEYSDKHPHTKYTIGYAGRPGGLDWYVNLVDNTLSHGPGGQSQYDVPTEADPCFGEVIEGKDIIDRIHDKAEVLPGSFRMMREFAVFESARISEK